MGTKLFLYFGSSSHFEDRVQLSFHRRMEIYGEYRVRERPVDQPELNILSCREAPWSQDPVPKITVLRKQNHPLEDENSTKLSCNCPRSVLSSQSEREPSLSCHRQRGRVFPEPGIDLPPSHWRATTAHPFASLARNSQYKMSQYLPRQDFVPDWRVYDPYGGETTQGDDIAMAPTFRDLRRQSHNVRICDFGIENSYISFALNQRDSRSYDKAALRVHQSLELLFISWIDCCHAISVAVIHTLEILFYSSVAITGAILVHNSVYSNQCPTNSFLAAVGAPFHLKSSIARGWGTWSLVTGGSTSSIWSAVSLTTNVREILVVPSWIRSELPLKLKG